MTRRAGPRAWLGFAVLALPTLLVWIDVSVTGALLLTQVQATAAGLSLLVVAYAVWNLGAAPLVSLSTGQVVGSAGLAGEATRDSLGGAVAAAASSPEPLAVPLLLAARRSFTSGMHLVAAVSAVVLCAVAVCTPRLLGHVQPIGATQPHAAPPSPLELPVYGDAA